MEAQVLQTERKRLLRIALLLDAAAYGISIPFLGITVSFAMGLLLGTVVLWCYLLLLAKSILVMAQQAKQTGTANPKRHMRYYVLRLLIFAVAFAAALLLWWIHPVGLVIPMLYPRLIYTGSALLGQTADLIKKR
ncbi:MAG: hypothetical protein IKM30_08770 [Oscillospiraceae bacterium]|nr:hypothetical protein [Oscillospiraceae bacterium]